MVEAQEPVVINNCCRFLKQIENEYMCLFHRENTYCMYTVFYYIGSENTTFE